MSFYTSSPLVVSALCLLLVYLILQRDYRSFVYRIFAFSVFSSGLWGMAVFFMRSNPDVGGALFWQKLVIVPSFASAIFFYNFTVAYTGFKTKRWILPATYILLILVAIFSRTTLLIKDIYIDSSGYYMFIPGSLLIPLSVIGFALVLMGLSNFIRCYRNSDSYLERNRVIYIILGTIFSLLGTTLDFFPLFDMHTIPTSIIGNTIFVVLTSIAVLRYHLLDIHFAVRKGTAYFLISATVAVPYVGIIFWFHQLFEGEIPVWAYLAILLVLAFALQPLWQRLQRFVDRFYYRERYDFLKALESFSQEPHDISDIKRLGSSLVRLIDLALQTSGVHLLLLSESEDFNVIASTNKNVAQLTLRSYSPLLQWLRTNKGLLNQRELDIIPQLQSLTARERDEIDVIEAELFVPLKTQQDGLVGVLILGKTLSEQPYSSEDERLILTVASRVAIELENARLYNIETMMRQELQRQDEQKIEFLHSVAHELKTPLTAIISSSELISTGAGSATPNQRGRLIANINRSAWLMDKRVGELLDLAKVQIGTLELNLEATEIGALIEEVASQLGSIFNMKNQVLTLELPEIMSPANADRERIGQVLLNLLSNANKFSPSDSRIVLRAREINSIILVEVQDSAPLISKEDREKLFDPYYRGGNSDERTRVPGLGLGLAISKRLIELHHGKIWVESESGTGNSFIFSIPVWSEKPGETNGTTLVNRTGGNLESINHRR